MSDQQDAPSGPDLAMGVDEQELVKSGKLVGHVGDEAVLLVADGDDIFAVGTPIARIITVHSSTAFPPAGPYAVPGTTPASICAPAKRCMRQPSMRSATGE